MKRTQLAAAVLLATGSVSAFAATYSVTPLPLQDSARSNFGRSIDEAGQMLTIAQLEYNPPIDVDQLINGTVFFEQFGASLENEDSAREGVFTDADYSTIVSYIISNQTFPQIQKLTQFRTYITDTVDAELVPGLDKITDKFDDYTQSVRVSGRDSLSGDYVVGDSGGLVILDPYENADGDIINYTYPESSQQAFVQVSGETKVLPSVDDTLGGFASARAINNNLQVAGFSTVSFQTAVDEAIERCNDDDLRGDISIDRCLFNLYTGSFTAPRISTPILTTQNLPVPGFVSLSEVNATIWQLDVNGDVINTQTYPLVEEPDEENSFYSYTYAFDINDQGIAVGESLTGAFVAISRPNASVRPESERVATVFRDGETIELLPRGENIISQAIGINNNNWITGAVLPQSSTASRSSLFVYNLETEEKIYPEGFFTSGAVTPNAINNNNIVVGTADVVATNETQRQTAAFMYNIETEELIDLNDLVSCDNTYELVEAVDINDSNEIIANARLRTTRKHVTGVEILNSSGETDEVDSIVAVKLSPLSNGTIDDCELPRDEQPYERQAASTGWLALGGMVLAGLFRRRIKR
ncbi:DUF3466 family protein [Alteromonas sp. A081]|uniref:DUF3466 family protein n=1 Tax=Alteromonas sp. A081 TaxID=3410269 RepID=UPI003B97F97B